MSFGSTFGLVWGTSWSSSTRPMFSTSMSAWSSLWYSAQTFGCASPFGRLFKQLPEFCLLWRIPVLNANDPFTLLTFFARRRGFVLFGAIIGQVFVFLSGVVFPGDTLILAVSFKRLSLFKWKSCSLFACKIGGGLTVGLIVKTGFAVTFSK